MKIKREYDGVTIEIELTTEELMRAHAEMEHLWTTEDLVNAFCRRSLGEKATLPDLNMQDQDKLIRKASELLREAREDYQNNDYVNQSLDLALLHLRQEKVNAWVEQVMGNIEAINTEEPAFYMFMDELGMQGSYLYVRLVPNTPLVKLTIIPEQPGRELTCRRSNKDQIRRWLTDEAMNAVCAGFPLKGRR